MDLKDVYDQIDFYTRKNGWGLVTIADKDRIVDRVQIDLMGEIKPAYGSNQTVNDALLPFRKPQTFNNGTSANGTITLNEDYVHLLAASTVVLANGKTRNPNIELVREDQLASRLDSALVPVSVMNPIALLIAPVAVGGQYRLQLYPESPAAGTIYYLRKPQEVNFYYSQVGRVITYNISQSDQLEWNEPMTNKIILKTLQGLGINLQDVGLVQYAQAKEGS